MSNNLVLQEEPEFDDDVQVSSDEVNAFLDQQEQQDSQKEKNSLDLAEEELLALQKRAKEAQDSNEKQEDDQRIKISPDSTFNQPTNYFTDMVVTVRDDQHVITDQDKEKYLESMLQDTQLELPIVMNNGITVVCRDLNMYERDLSINAVKDYSAFQGLTPQAVLLQMRKYRIPMQIVSINNKKFNTVSFQYSGEYDLQKFEEDTQKLKEQSNKVIMPMSVSLQGILNKAVNIFEHKLARLEEAAFNQDFWNPVGRD